MSPHSSRPVIARALAVLLTVLLAVTGVSLPAFADDVVGTPAPVETAATAAPVPTVDAEVPGVAPEPTADPTATPAPTASPDPTASPEPAPTVIPTPVALPEATEPDAVPEALAAPITPATARMVFFAPSTVADGNVVDGTVAWSISELMGRSVTGFASPRSASYVAPATFAAGAPGVSTWAGAVGSVDPDGSASLAFLGTSVNHASTGGGWLRLAALEAELDADGNGTVSAIVSYGTSTPPANYDSAQTPVRGPVRVDVVALSGNTAAQASLDDDSATWTGLTGSWSTEFLAFVQGTEIPGVSAATAAWAYQSNITGATASSGGSAGLARTPSAFSFSLELTPPPAPVVFDAGSAAWSISELMGRSITGFASPRASAYVAPATFSAGTPGTSTWAGGSGAVAHDGSATVAFAGTSVNHASTGGGWLRITDPQAELDADGNGALSAIVSYGTSTPPANYDATQTPVRGPVRVNVMALTGNTSAQVQVTDDTATWTGLAGSWDAQFLAFVQGADIPGVSAATAAWAYQSNITGATASSGGSAGLARTPSTISFSLGFLPPPLAPVVFDDGAVAWSISELMGRSVTGFASPRASAYVAPATFAAGSPGTSTWAAGSGTVAHDGSASLTFAGTSVNHASTGGGWLRITDPQAVLDADGNGTLSAIVSYGTSTPPANYDSAQTPVRGPVRVNVMALTGNTSAQVQVTDDSATWSGLTGSWSPQFLAFVQGADIPGVSAATAAWAYQSNITGATASSGGSAGLARTPSPVSFSLGFQAPVVVVTPAVALSTSPSSGIVQGTAVTFTATVTPATAGTVVFRSGDTVIGSRPVTATDGTAVLPTSGLAVGSSGYVAAFTPTDLVHAAAATSPVVTFEVFAPVAVAPGFFSWGVKASFRTYIVTTAQGTVTLGAGAGAVGGVYRFPQTGGGTYDPATGLGSSNYRGSVAFWGHEGALALTFSDPVVRVTSSTSAALSVFATGSGRVDIATLALAAGGRSVDGTGAVTYSNVPATLTAAGATAFAGFYPVGEALDPVSFVIGSAAAPLGGGVVVAAAATSTANTPDATPPATEGVTSDATGFTAGGTATFTADGYQPNESGILAVIYSEPTVLADDLTADASGAVSWTGKLPVGLTGEHTFTFQGSVDRGIVIEIAAAEQVGCLVEGAVLDWGVKESFRAYIDGSIANGEWTTADGATYETPLFTWATGAGGYDADSGDADLAFAGSVRFTGHSGALDTTIANPRVVIVGDRAVLLLDITGTTQSGETVARAGVEFAELDLAAAEQTGGGDLVAFTGIPATLTAAGAAAFGTYPEGEVLDPVDLSITLDPACVEPAVVVDEPQAETESASAASPLPWIIGALVLLLVAALIAFLVRRARRAA